jgi:hypothetical protein
MFHSYRIPFAPVTQLRPNHRFLSSLSLTPLFPRCIIVYISRAWTCCLVVSSRETSLDAMRLVIIYHSHMPPILSKVCTFQKKKKPPSISSPRCIVQSGSQSRFLKNKNKRNFANTSRLTFLSKTKLCDASPMAVDYVLVSPPPVRHAYARHPQLSSTCLPHDFSYESLA